MQISRKIQLAKDSINSIARHDDADLTIRRAAVHQLIDHAQAELTAAEARVQAKVADALAVPGAE